APPEFAPPPPEKTNRNNGGVLQPHRLAPPAGQNIGSPPPRFIYSKFGDRDAIPKTAEYEAGDLPDEVAAIALGKTHASGFFLAMYLLIAVGFVAASAIICGQPAASIQMLSQAPNIGGYFARPVVPAMLVSLRDVQSQYRVLKGGNPALVVTGTAQNVGRNPLHLVQIDGLLLGAEGRPLSHETVLCGNDLSAKMMDEMTPREIEFSQGMTPRNNFRIEPAASAPFLMIFQAPPGGASTVRIGVTKAVALHAPPRAGVSDAP